MVLLLIVRSESFRLSVSEFAIGSAKGVPRAEDAMPFKLAESSLNIREADLNLCKRCLPFRFPT